MNCPKCQMALQPGMLTCPSCNAVFTAAVEQGSSPSIAAPQSEQPSEAAAEQQPADGSEKLIVQQVTNVTGVPAAIVPKWRRLKPVGLVALFAPLGLLVLIGLLVTGDVYKPERGESFFQPLSENDKIKLAAVSAAVQSILLVLLLSI